MCIHVQLNYVSAQIYIYIYSHTYMHVNVDIFLTTHICSTFY